MTSPVPVPCSPPRSQASGPSSGAHGPDLPPVCPLPSHTSGPHHAALSGHTPIRPGAAGFHCGASSQTGRWGPNDESEGRRWVDGASEDGGGGAKARRPKRRKPEVPGAAAAEGAWGAASGSGRLGASSAWASAVLAERDPHPAPAASRRNPGDLSPPLAPSPPPLPGSRGQFQPQQGGSAPGGGQQAHPPEPGPGPFKMTSPGPRVLRGRGSLERGRAWWDQDVLC